MRDRICSQCGHAIASYATVCPFCRADVALPTSDLLCKTCGCRLAADFCSGCAKQALAAYDLQLGLEEAGYLLPIRPPEELLQSLLLMPVNDTIAGLLHYYPFFPRSEVSSMQEVCQDTPT